MQFGGADGDRTHDLRIANATLSQLSYRPTLTRLHGSPRKGANGSVGRGGCQDPPIRAGFVAVGNADRPDVPNSAGAAVRAATS